MGFEITEIQDTKLETNQIPIQKEEGFLDNNPEIKGIYNNFTRKYPNIDSENFEQIIKNILDKVSKENILKYLPNILNDLIANDRDFLNGDINDILLILKSELNIKETKQEDKETKQEDKETKQEDKETKQEDKETKQEDKETKQEDKEIKEMINKEILNLNNLYQSIPNSFKPENEKNKEDFDKFTKFNLTLEIRSKLENAGIPIDEYLTHRYTAQQLSKSGETLPNKYEFIKSFNQLNKLLDIDIQIPLVTDKIINYKPLPDSLDDFQTKPEKILALDSVKDYIDSSPDILDDENITMQDGDIVNLYSDRIPNVISEILSKNNLPQDLIKYFDIKNYDKKTGILNKKAIKEIKDDKLLNHLHQISKAVSEKFIMEGKEEIKKITNKIVKEKIMTSIFRGVSEFFDITNKNIENFSSDFKLDFNQDIKLENNVVKIDGILNGSFVGLYYDLNTGKLKMDDVVSLDSENKIYKIGKKTGTLLDVPIKLPKLDDFYKDAKKFNYTDISKKSDNIDEYKKKLNQEIGPIFYGNFIHKELNQYYIRRLNEKNLAVQSALNYSFENRSTSVGSDKSFDTQGGIEFKKDLNPGHFEFAKIIDDSFEYYSKSDNLLKIRNLFEKFDMIINSKKVRDGESEEDIINKLFNSQEMLDSANNWKSMGSSYDFNYLHFYKLISKSRGDKQIIDLDILDRVVSVLEKSESLSAPANKKKFNGNFWDKYDKIINDPDNILGKIEVLA